MKEIPIRKIKTSQEQPNFVESFSIRNVKDLLSDKDMVQELHRHDFFFILALEKGVGNHEIDFVSYKVCNHSVFFMRPGQVHKLSLKAGSIGYLMEFKTDFYYHQNKVSNPLLRNASNKNLCQLDGRQFERLHTILNYLFQEYTDKKERYWDVIKANLDIFLVELVRHRKNKNALNRSSSYKQERLDEFLELLENHTATHKQASQYAGMLNLSGYQLNAITKAMLGKTCSEVIDEYIILESKRYLLTTSNQVNQIAYHLGYEDVSYFIRFFKKHTGKTPDTFRHNLG